MKRKTTIRFKLFVGMLLLATAVQCISSAAVASIDVAAKTSNSTKAKKAYKEALAKGTLNYLDYQGKSQKLAIKAFRVLDIDQDGTPELIVKDVAANNGSPQSRAVYTYKKGKLKYLGYHRQNGDAKLKYNKKYKALGYWWWTNTVGGSGVELLKISKGKLVSDKYLYECYTYGTDIKNYEYGTGGKTPTSVSEKKYKSLVKKYWNNTIKEYKFLDNTQSNRNRL